MIHGYLKGRIGRTAFPATWWSAPSAIPWVRRVPTATSIVGFARVVTDLATFGYVADVFVIEGFRRRGLSKWLMECIVVIRT